MVSNIDRFVNDTTMYRLVALVLGSWSAVGIVLAAFGRVSFSPSWMIGTLGSLVAACLFSNWLFARIHGTARNVESSLITALILFLILFPAQTWRDLSVTVFVGMAAMASKYLLVWNRRHVFNPAAVGALCADLLGLGAAWWVGSPWMLPWVIIGGALIVRKTRRWYMVAAFVPAVLVSLAWNAASAGMGLSVISLFRDSMLSWPVVFFAVAMLTEPLTLPASKRMQVAESALVGLLFSAPFHFGSVSSSPELALLIGNAFACVAGLKRTYRLRFARSTEVAPGVFEFAFEPDAPARFCPGQYFEWTLPHANPDARGNRRTFTVASAPGETLVRLGVRMPERPSSFKRALAALKPGDVVFGSNVGGEFVLPADASAKIAFVAGGIGITPFRSMVQDLLNRNERRDAILFYACKTPKDFAYRDLFERASHVGIRAVFLATDQDGFLTEETVRAHVPDFLNRKFYLSGPPAMVQSYRDMLRRAGVSSGRIHVDYFPGY